jgi:Conserved protein/domain typically associated with flavoprotein oxygenases, DIM6/NTAB family
MSRINFKAGTMIYPLPAVLVSCGDTIDNYNVMTAAWVGTICSEPPMCYVSIRPSRLCHSIICETKEFVLNLTTEELAEATDWCGVRSGRDYNKFIEKNLTPIESTVVSAPSIAQSPLSIECKVEEIKSLGSHDMFIARVVNVNCDDKYIDKATGEFSLEKAKLMAYSHGKYYSMGKRLGFFGYSVQKKKASKK